MNDARMDDFDRGLANRRAALGDAWVEQATGTANAFNADFQSLVTRYAWHEVWGRPGLDWQTRRLLVLGMTMGMARWEEFELHCRAAVRGGVPLEAIREALLQGAVYCGVPAANTAFKITQAILRAEGVALEPAPLTPGQRVARHHTFSQPQLQVALQGADDGVPVVLSHVLGLDLSMWDAQAAALADSHPVLRYDHRGHGDSAVPPGPYTIDDLVDDAARLIREWGRGRVVFVGVSLGGMVGQGLALRYPELLRGLVLSNTFARTLDAARPVWDQRIEAVRSGGMAALADATIERWLHPETHAAQPALVAAIREKLLRCDPQGYVASCQAVAGLNLLDQLSQIRCPTLVITGQQDVGATPEIARDIASRIPGAQLELVDRSGHLTLLEHPALFDKTLNGFLATLR